MDEICVSLRFLSIKCGIPKYVFSMKMTLKGNVLFARMTRGYCSGRAGSMKLCFQWCSGVRGGLPDAWGKESSRSRHRIRLNWSTLDFAGPDPSLSVIVLFQGRTSHHPRSPVCQQDAFQMCSQRISKALVSMASVTMLDERASGNPQISWNVILTPVYHSPMWL